MNSSGTGLARKTLLLLSLTAVLPAGVESQSRAYPPILPGAQVETYKTVDDVELQTWIFTPEGHRDSDRRAAMVFFFGGGWRQGSPGQFAKHCAYLAERGMVAMTADYRVLNRHGVKANTCVADAKSAIRWTRKNASRLGIDPDRIAAGGGSAGGHLAAATATLPAHDGTSDDLSISAQPNALVLFNPVAVLADIDGQTAAQVDWFANLAERLGGDAISMSPYHHIRPGIAPTIIFHGTDDKTVAYDLIALFCSEMNGQGNRCELVGYQRSGHGFFNYGRGGNAAFIDTVYKMDAFLVSLGYLDPAPETVFYP
jgi:acetyl esterase/lipase